MAFYAQDRNWNTGSTVHASRDCRALKRAVTIIETATPWDDLFFVRARMIPCRLCCK